MKMMIKRNKWLLILPLCAVIFACAEKTEESTDEIEQRIIDAYLYSNPGYSTTSSGLCYKVEQEGTGYEFPKDDNFVYVNYTGYDFKGNIVINGTLPYSNSEDIAKQLGTFAYTKYYGPKIWGINKSTLYTGLEEAVKMMKPNGKMRVIMPSWLSAMGTNSSRSLTAPMIVDIELLTVITDITKYQATELSLYAFYNYAGLDSTEYNFFYKTLKQGVDNLPQHGDTLDVRYVGYLLDGFVFDTNIADTASHYRIYDKDNEYKTLSVVLDTSSTSNDYVLGFKKALEKMTEKSEAVTIFSSDYGYRSEGSGEIQPYSPLRFHLSVERIRRKPETE